NADQEEKEKGRSTGINGFVARYRFHAVVLLHGNNGNARNIAKGGSRYS
ncbi:MAG: hypothetical protein RL266_2213, partial [Bacteroidota bacterium]